MCLVGRYNLLNQCSGQERTDYVSEVIRLRIRDFLKDSSTLRDREFFHNSAHTSRKTGRMGSSRKCHHRCLFRQSVPITFLEIIWIRSQDSGSRLDSPWRRSALSEWQCSCLSHRACIFNTVHVFAFKIHRNLHSEAWGQAVL